MKTSEDSSRPPTGEGKDWLTSPDTVWLVIALVLPAAIVMTSPIRVTDLAYHLRAGEQMLSTGSILREDTFSFVQPGQPWLNQQWGAQVVFAALYRLGGFAMISFARGVIVAATAGLLFLTCRGRGADRRTASILTLLGTLLAMPFLSMRPQLFGLLMFAAALWILTTRGSHPRRLLALPMVAMVWANLHGSFLLLVAVLVLSVLESVITRREDLRALLVVGGLAVVATIVTPFGADVWSYAIGLTTNPVIRDAVTEWAPLTVRDPVGLAFFASGAAVVVVLLRRSAWVSFIDLLWLGTFFFAGLAAMRAAAWWGFVAPAVLAGVQPRSAPIARRTSVGVNRAFLLAAGVSLVLVLPWWRTTGLTSAPQTLVEATRESTDPGNRVVVHQPFASWFEFALPDRPVFVDSRIELYSDAVWADYQGLTNGLADWPEILDRWDVDAIVARRSWELIPFIREDPAWRTVFEDEDGLVFVRS